MHTRSEDARVRILALACVTEMWKAEGGKLVGTSLHHTLVEIRIFSVYACRFRRRNGDVHRRVRRGRQRQRRSGSTRT